MGRRARSAEMERRMGWLRGRMLGSVAGGLGSGREGSER